MCPVWTPCLKTVTEQSPPSYIEAVETARVETGRGEGSRTELETGAGAGARAGVKAGAGKDHLNRSPVRSLEASLGTKSSHSYYSEADFWPGGWV